MRTRSSSPPVSASDASRPVPASPRLSTPSMLLRQRFGDARLIGVGVHPTSVRSVNRTKDELNRRMAAVWSRDPRACFVDPLEAFGVPPGAAAPPELMYDVIHYNDVAMLRIKALIRRRCDTEF